jgi:hypothetical protein
LSSFHPGFSQHKQAPPPLPLHPVHPPSAPPSFPGLPAALATCFPELPRSAQAATLGDDSPFRSSLGTAQPKDIDRPISPDLSLLPRGLSSSSLLLSFGSPIFTHPLPHSWNRAPGLQSSTTRRPYVWSPPPFQPWPTNSQ